MIDFLKKRLIEPLIGFLKQGVSPSQLALAVSLGIVIATVPVFGTTTILCLVAIWLFKINPAVILLTNQFAYPLQFVLYFPIIRLGEWAFNQTPLPLSFTRIYELFLKDWSSAISTLWWSTVFGVLVWLPLAIAITYGLYFVFKIIFIQITIRMNGEPANDQNNFN